MSDLDIGSEVPSFTAIDHDGDQFSSDDLEGTPYILYFYPKDDTPGCTAQACSFRDNLEGLENQGITVIGVSPDSPKSHQRFMEKYDLNFTILSDEDFELCRMFDVLKNGTKVERTTFIIDGEGIIQWIERPVVVEGHVERVSKAVKDLKL